MSDGVWRSHSVSLNSKVGVWDYKRRVPQGRRSHRLLRKDHVVTVTAQEPWALLLLLNFPKDAMAFRGKFPENWPLTFFGKKL